MQNYIGIDLGGTLIRVAKVSEVGEILYEVKSESLAQSGPEVVLNNIIEMTKNIPDYQDCLAIGMGIPGPVDTYNGVVTMATNIPGFKGYPVVETLEKALGLRVFMDNDANVAGLAEALVGAGKGHPIVYYITHSTGIGGGLIVDGHIVSGMSGYAGEIGNIKVTDSEVQLNHLVPGAVENEASGTAIGRRAKGEVNTSIEDSKQLFEVARFRDEKALALIDDVAKKFATMMANIAHVVDPHVFVIGGGVTKAHDLYFDKVKEYYKSFVHEGMRDVEIVLAELEEPGVIGAAMLPISHGL